MNKQLAFSGTNKGAQSSNANNKTGKPGSRLFKGVSNDVRFLFGGLGNGSRSSVNHYHTAWR